MARRRRRGTTAVEFAVVLPVFFTFTFGLIEYGRLQLTTNVLKNAARQAARYGSTEGITTSDAVSRANAILASAMSVEDVELLVKDASAYDGGGTLPESSSDYTAMPDIELNDAEPRQLFVVRASVAYNEVALIPLECFSGVVLTAQSFMRHE
jgi:Flp pilus assembly protein TadG